MKLQTRLVITTVLTAIPLVLSLLWFERRSRYAMIEASLGATVLEALHGETLERCERSPSTFLHQVAPNPWQQRRGRSPGMGPMPMRLYAYDRDFRAHHPEAPPLASELVDGMRSEQSVSSRPIEFEGRVGFEALVKVPGGSTCAYVLARRPVPAIILSSPFQLRTSIAWLFPALGTLGALYVGIGLLVRRVTKLTRDVRASANAAYAELSRDSGDDEIAELRNAFADAGHEIRSQLSSLETKERILRDFLANTTHDVMLPLTVLQGHLAALTEEKRASGSPQTEAMLGALRESHYIGALLRNLALAAKLDGKHPEASLEPLDLGDLVARATARHRFMAVQQGVELNDAVPEAPLFVLGDSVFVEQAVSNVIYNAVTYNRAGGHVAVLLEENADGTFLLQVTDDGPGVAKEELSRLVERHFRGDSARSRSQGGGLGLNIAHRVAEIHGWTMKLAASAEGGLVVSFSGPKSVS